MRRTLALALVTLAVALGIAAPRLRGGDSLQMLNTPAGPGSGMYSLAGGADGATYLSWLEPQANAVHALKFSVWRSGRWSPAREIARSDHWFINWADHPSVVPLPNGSLVAHWLANNGTKTGSYGYGFRIALSTDHGATWREIHAGGTDNIRGYSGFVTIMPTAGGFTAVYLGPPRAKSGATEADQTMTLSAIRFAPDGRIVGEDVIDGDTCSCCTTAMTLTSLGPLTAYRDRAAGEIRDISIAHLRDAGWTEPRSAQHDGWQINACPTNGPSLSARDARVALAWFTAAQNRPVVKLAFSHDAGVTFKPAVPVDSETPIGWPAVVLLDDGSAVVTWLASTGGGRGEIRLRRAWPDGRVGVPVTLTSASAGRSTGILQMVRSGDQLLLAWRNERVQTALVPIPGR